MLSILGDVRIELYCTSDDREVPSLDHCIQGSVEVKTKGRINQALKAVLQPMHMVV